MGFSQSTPFTATPGSRPDVPVDAEQSVPARRAAARRQHARPEHVPRPEPRPVRAARASRTRSCRATSSTCSASCRDSGCSKSATPAATAATSRPNEELNSVPAQYLSTSRVRDQATIDFLGAQVTNPFAGLLPTGFTGATVARSQLLRPFPQFNNVPTNGFDGTSQYDSAQVQARAALQRRATRSSATYTAVALHRARVQAERDRRGLTRSGCRATTCRTA